MPSQAEKINKLDKDIALIKQEISVLKNNHLHHLDLEVKKISKILWSVGILVFSNLLILLRDLIL